MTIELILALLAILASSISVVVSWTTSIIRAKTDIKIRDYLALVASRDLRVNHLIRDANGSFVGRKGVEFTGEEAEELRRIIANQSHDNLSARDLEVVDSILSKSPRQMKRYGERMGHTIAGRRTLAGRLANKMLDYLAKLLT